jgi:hypothetical protein
MPVSVLTWANLNHGLCGTDSDPVYIYLESQGSGKWYYLHAEIYLSLASLLLGYGINYLVISVTHQILNLFGKKGKSD